MGISPSLPPNTNAGSINRCPVYYANRVAPAGGAMATDPMDEPIRSKAALVKTLADEILQMQTKQSDMVKGDAGIQIYIETQLKSFEGEGEEKAKAAALNSKCNKMWLPPVAECASTGGTLNAEVWKEASDLLRDDNESNLAKHVQSKLKVKLERP